MELRIDYSTNISGQEQLANRIAALAHELGHTCITMPMLSENEGDYPTMEMLANGHFALGSSSEIADALNSGRIETFLRKSED